MVGNCTAICIPGSLYDEQRSIQEKAFLLNAEFPRLVVGADLRMKQHLVLPAVYAFAGLQRAALHSAR